MPLLVKREQKEFALHPEGGPYAAVISEVREHQGVETKFGIKDRVQIVFQTTEQLRDHIAADDDRPMEISVFCNKNLNEGSRLLELVSHQVSKEALQGEIDLESLINTQWLITIQHSEANGKRYANVASFMKAPSDQRLDVWDEELGF